MQVLLTNDDGIEETGLQALHRALSSVADVTVVAPADDQSAVGRSMSSRVAVDEHELGYAIHGTPADCVVAGLSSLVPETDVVVSGCNRGANLGQYVLGRSGTISAAVEAAFFGVPAIAVSMYIPTGEVDYRTFDPGYDEYAEAMRVAEYLVDRALDRGVFEEADYLNVNVPVADGEPCEMEVTTPSTVYDMGAKRRDGHITLVDRIWGRMAEGETTDPVGTDRRAILERRVSVSPLTAAHTARQHDALDALAVEF
ncbi:5'/3'-nucleotidase SurE [Halomarina ordinaria]|uniref:5'-nucleotidase SurE n=1 Tax=Halomarina ordinaria TaxID=3033939 RepID=A0ABD5U5I4_9EURY|nr:5'/3'-nucleotidase SurE [Halomarina sp. PSRA2]